MKVVHINVTDVKGGAARAAYRLHQGLRQQQCDSTMFVAEKYGYDPTVIHAPANRLAYFERRFLWKQLSFRFWRYGRTRPTGLGPFTSHKTRLYPRLVQKASPADVYHWHWVAHFIDIPLFLQQTTQPIIWTLHDQNGMTGGCHYALDCDRFGENCGACPQLGSGQDGDASRQIWLGKKRAYQAAHGRLHVVTPSQWLAHEARRSPLLRDAPISVIPNGLDTAVYAPQETQSLRQKLNIPLQTKILLFSADSLKIQRKGMAYLLHAMPAISQSEDVWLVSMGGGQLDIPKGINYRSVGHVSNENEIAEVYSLADLFVLPSLADNLPNTVMEAMACGTPTVAFNVGGVGDMVRPGVTGALVPAAESQQLAQTIRELLGNEDLQQKMAANCRRVAETEYALPQIAQNYIALYRDVLGAAL